MYALGLILGVRVLVYAFGCVLFAVLYLGIYGIMRPHLRYKKFLENMQTGLRRTVVGEYLGMDEELQQHDDVQVHAVRIRLDEIENAEEDDDLVRIYYVNHTKTSFLPVAGTRVTASCWGRHLTQIGAEEP